LTGEAGSGKSTIASSVARHFDEEEVNAPRILAANLFCSRQFEETKQKTNITPSMKALLVDPWMQSISERGSASWMSY
jgi:cytidylate kinase